MISLSAKQKRLALFGAIGVALVAVMWLSDNPADKKAKAQLVKSEPIKNIIAPGNSRDYGIEALQGKVNKLTDKIDELADGNERVIQRAISRTQRGYEDQVRELQSQIQNLTATIEDLKQTDHKSSNPSSIPEKIAGGGRATNQNIAGRTPSASWGVRIKNDEASDFFNKKEDDRPSPSSVTPNGGVVPATASLDQKLKKPEIVVLKQDRGEDEQKDEKVKDVVFELPPLPSGSMFKATNITGLDVPTSQVAKDNPYPALMRIKDLAILPNKFRADIRECHALFSGYGEISSERAYLRATSLSCLRSDGAVLESKMEAYVVGEDGKAGARGRLVEKQGKFLAHAALAGVADGISKVFSSTAVPTIATGSPGDTLPFQRVLSGQSAQSAALSGASSAAEMLANYYIKRAEEISPILEIDAGRNLSFVLIKPLEMKFKVIKAKKSQG